MKIKELNSLIHSFEALESESLNGDPMYFNGKIVLPLEENEILKIMCRYTFNGDNDIFEAAKKEGIDFYTPYHILHEGVVCLASQPKLKLRDFVEEPIRPKEEDTLNVWCPNPSPETDKIIYLIKKDYGEDGWRKIQDFNKKYYIGNIAWRNIGFNTITNKIECFDFFVGLARDGEGHLRVRG